MISTDFSDKLTNPAEQLLRRWEQGERVELKEFLGSVGPLSTSDLAAVLYVDQHQRWHAGERTSAESYFELFPEVCVDVEAVIDLVFHEYLIRERLGDDPKLPEYVSRFPQYAKSLQSQITFHCLLNASQSAEGEPSFASTDSVPTKRPSQTSLRGQSNVRLFARGGLSSTRKLQLLLRQRLRLFSAISCVMFLLQAPVVWTVLAGYWGIAMYSFVIAVTGLFAALLSSRFTFSMRALRWVETCLMGSVLLYFAWEQVQMFRAGELLTLAGLGWFGPLVAARSLNWSWAVTIIVYGVWIPNTARRSMIVVVAMSVVFIAITLGLALTAENAGASAIAGFVLYSTTHTVAAAAIAIFGAYRIQSLQRDIMEARKLGPYRLIRPLGSGGMGEVYLAEHTLLRRPCALKLIRDDQGDDERSLSRFEREVQAMATLTHPNTVRVYDYGLAADGTFYYAMEYLPGLSLQELVARHGPLPPGRVVYLLRQVCQALREAHSVGLIHRDIKPANILASQAGGMYDVAKLLDFGLVRNHRVHTASSLTEVGVITGTPAFMSPEQATGTIEVDERSDIYSLGAVAYLLLTGRPPFIHATSVETMAAHLSEPITQLRLLRPDTPADLERVILRCLEKEPGERFADVATVESALAGCACRVDWSWEQAAEWWKSQVPEVSSTY